VGDGIKSKRESFYTCFFFLAVCSLLDHSLSETERIKVKECRTDDCAFKGGRHCCVFVVMSLFCQGE